MRIPPPYRSSAWLLVVTAIGVTWGRGTRHEAAHGLIFLAGPAAVAAILLLAVGIARAIKPPEQPGVYGACFALMVYASILLVADPQLWSDGVAALFAVAPLLAGCAFLAGRRARCATVGASILYAASVALMVHNVGNRGGCGFAGVMMV